MRRAVFMASGTMYWPANRWRGRHWPIFCGLLDWSGHRRPDVRWAVAAISGDQRTVEGRPAATLGRLDHGEVLRFAFWPTDDSLFLISVTSQAQSCSFRSPAPDRIAQSTIPRHPTP